MNGQRSYIAYRAVAMHMDIKPWEYPGGSSEWNIELKRLRDEFHTRMDKLPNDANRPYRPR